MELLQWTDRPELRRPVLIASFEGWNDAGDASTTAVRWLAERLGAEQVARIDGEEFYDYTSVRPEVEIVEGSTRRIEWPEPQIWAARLTDAPRDVVAVIGHEPQLRWRTFCATIVEAARLLDVELVITLGALLAEVPHSRATSVIGTAEDPGVIERLGLRPSTYEGPTGITGVLHAACR
ncbi:MAG TPA: PAC2 family protein, partial [Acidimicrobiales bacterium]